MEWSGARTEGTPAHLHCLRIRKCDHIRLIRHTVKSEIQKYLQNVRISPGSDIIQTLGGEKENSLPRRRTQLKMENKDSSNLKGSSIKTKNLETFCIIST